MEASVDWGWKVAIHPDAFLVSDDARWITGDTVRVDGGSKL